MENSRKIWYDQNDQPPKNYIWYKNGQYLEWNGSKWTVSEGLNNKDEITENMTQEQQMQARKNLGLYYEETSVEQKEVISNGSSDTKLSDDSPKQEDIISLLNFGQVEVVISFADRQEGGYYIKSGTEGFPFYVTDDGIYINDDLFYGYKLIYNGEVTTISKVPEKFLPEQEQEPVILDITAPLESGEYINVETLYGLSAKDMTNIYNGKILALRYPIIGDDSSGIYTLLTAGKNSEGNPYHADFVDSGGNKYTFEGFDNTPADIYISEPDGVKPISITELPTAAMTTLTQLAAIGLTINDVWQASLGERTGISINLSDNTYFVPIISANKVSASFNLKFKFVANTYDCTLDGINETATVTITPD